MKVFANAAMIVGAVVLMGWLMLAQRAYQQSWNESLTAQAGSAHPTDSATSIKRAMLALN